MNKENKPYGQGGQGGQGGRQDQQKPQGQGQGFKHPNQKEDQRDRK